MTSMVRVVSLVILTTLIVFLGFTFFQIVAPFLLPLFLAGVTAVWCQPLYGYFLTKFRQRDRWAAAATTGTVCLILFIPLVIGVFSAAIQIWTLSQKEKPFVISVMENLQKKEVSEEDIKVQVRRFAGLYFDFTTPSPVSSATDDERATYKTQRTEFIADWEQKGLDAIQHTGLYMQELAKKSLGIAATGNVGLASKTFDILGAMVSGLIQLTIFLIALYYFLCDGSSLLSATEKLVPVQVDYQRQLIHEFNRVVQAVVSATMLSAIAQGAATALALYVVGFHNFFVLFVVATFASLIPIAGTWMVWGPFAVGLCLGKEPSYGSAIFLAVVGIAVIGTMDNVIKAYVLQNDTSLHPLLAFVSVFGGMQVMGLWGIFVGPIVACCLHALVKIFNMELGEFSRAKFGHASGGAENSLPVSPPAEPQPAAAVTATPGMPSSG